MESPIVLLEPVDAVGSPDLDAALQAKYKRLQTLLKGMARVVVAYSGGVDSSLVTKVALDTLGATNTLAVIALSPSLGRNEERAALAVLQEIGAPYVAVQTHEVEDPRYAANPANRCYFCKDHVYAALADVAEVREYAWVVDGFNLEDTGDHRPGRQAGREQGVRSPLHEAGMNKADIRALAHFLGLSNWAKPAMACLSSRVEYGTAITPAILRQIDQAECALQALGLVEVRVRHHGNLARIEVNADALAAVMGQRSAITQAVKAAGYVYVTLDMQGLRHGSMNEALTHRG